MRKLVPLAVVLGLMTVWPHPHPVVSGQTVAIFPLSIKGKSYQPGVSFGLKAPSGKLNDKTIAATLQGTLADFAATYLDLDPGGKFYVYFDGRDDFGLGTFRVATNTNGVNTTTLNASISPEGLFWATGKYTMPVIGQDADVFMTGKISFIKGTFNPKKITGTLNFMFTKAGFNEVFTVKFKTLAPVV